VNVDSQYNVKKNNSYCSRVGVLCRRVSPSTPSKTILLAPKKYAPVTRVIIKQYLNTVLKVWRCGWSAKCPKHSSLSTGQLRVSVNETVRRPVIDGGTGNLLTREVRWSANDRICGLGNDVD